MISRTYKELLPAYLDGSNIREHAGIIEAQDKLVDDKIEYLSQWNLLERPILIERIQEDDDEVTIRLHINTPSPIRSIVVTGDVTDTLTPDDTVTTELVEEYTLVNPYADEEIQFENCHFIDFQSRIYNPSIIVTVTTDEGKTYQKGYPENDTQQDNIYDHDKFLDIIGTLVNIPRRQYSQYILASALYCENLVENYNNTVPSYLGKTYEYKLVDLGGGYWQDRVYALPSSEDDYYYYARLTEYIENPTLTGLIQAYGVNSHLFTRIDEAVITHDEGSIVLCYTVNTALNMDSSNLIQSVSNLLPVSRDLITIPRQVIKTRWNSVNLYPNLWQYRIVVGVSETGDRWDNTWHPVAYYPFMLELSIDYAINLPYEDVNMLLGLEGVTDGDGEYLLTLRGFPITSGWVYTYFTGGEDYEEFIIDEGRSSGAIPSYTYHSYIYPVFTLSLDAWDYVKMGGTPVVDANLVTPALDSNDYLCMGRGYLTYTPAMDLELVDTSAYTLLISFHATGSKQRLGLTTIDTENGTTELIDWICIDDYTSTYDYSTTHTITYKFLNGVAYIYFDGIYTGRSTDYSNIDEGMLYVAGYNIQPTTNSGGLYIGSISVDNTVDISTTPTTSNPVIQTLPTDLTTSWTSVQSSTTNRTPVVNSDGTFDCGCNYYNLIHEITKGNEYSFIIDFNNTVTSFYFAFIRFNNDAIQNLVSFNNTKVSDPSDLITGNNRLVLTVARDGKVTAYFKTDSYEIGTVNDGNPYRLMTSNYNTSNTLTVDSIRVCDSVLSSTEINTILGNGGGAMTKYSIAKTGNTDENNLSTIFTGGNNTTNNDGSLHIGTSFTRDYLEYTSDTDYIINMEILINTFDYAHVVLDGATSYIWSVHNKRIEHTNSSNISFTDIDYTSGDTVFLQIIRNGTSLTWKITANGNTETITYNDYQKGSNDRFSMRAHGSTADIDMLNYTRLTKIEDEEEE